MVLTMGAKWASEGGEVGAGGVEGALITIPGSDSLDGSEIRSDSAL